MNRKFYFRTAVLSVIVVCLGVTSCINKDYRINELDKGVHLAPNGFSIPLGFLNRKTLGDIINEDLIVEGADGEFMLRYDDVLRYQIKVPGVDNISFGDLSSFFDPVTVSPDEGGEKPATFTLSENSTDVPLDVPTFDFAGQTNIQQLRLESNKVFPGGITPGVTTPGVTGAPMNFTSNNGQIEVKVEVPYEIYSVNTVWLGTKNLGTPVTVKVNPNGLSAMLSRISVENFTVNLPSYYKLNAASGQTGTVTGNGTNSLTITNFEMTAPFEMTFYIVSLDLSSFTRPPLADGAWMIDDTKTFNYSITSKVDVNGGTPTAEAPQAIITGDPAFADATFTTADIDFKLDQPFVKKLDYVAGPFPSIVEKFNKIVFAAGQKTLTVSIGDLGLPFATSPDVKITFPSLFNLTDPAGRLSGNVLTAPASEFVGGYTLQLNSVTFGAGEGVPNVGGYIDFADYDYNIVVDVNHTFPTQDFTWSTQIRDLEPAENVEVVIGEAVLGIDYDAPDNSILIAEVSKEIGGTNSIEQEFDLPKEIKNIGKVFIDAIDDTEATMKLSVNIKNPLLEEFYLDNLMLQLPDFVEVSGANVDPETNKYFETHRVINSAGSNDFNVTLADVKITGLKNVGIKTVAEGLVGFLEGDVEYSAIARTPSGSSITATDDMIITPKLEITGIKVTGLEGMFDIALEDYMDDGIDPISLEDIYKHLGSGKQQPDLAPPVITLEVSNPVGVNFLGNISLDPKDGNGVSLLENPVTLNSDKLFKINPATSSDAEVTKVYITDNGEATAPTGYKGYNLAVSKLVDIIPHTIDIDVSGNVNPDGTLLNTLSLDQDYDFELEYAVEVPIAFGPEMEMEMEFDIDDMNSLFSDLAKQQVKAADITVYAALAVSFPLVLEDVDAEFTDEEGGSIPGLTTTVSGSVSGPAGGGAVQESLLTIKMNVPEGGDFTTLKDIDILKIKIPIRSADTSTGAKNHLNAKDYIEGKVWAELAKGVSVDLDEL